MEDTALISERGTRSFLYRLPSLKLQLPLMAVFSLLYSLPLSLSDIQTYLMIGAVFFLPGLLSLLLLPYMKSYKAKMNLRQSGVISLISLLFGLPLYFILIHTGLPLEPVLLISIAFPISFRFLTITAAFQHRPMKSLPPSLVQSLLPLLFFQIFYDLSLMNFSGYLITVVVGISLILFVIPFINRPFKRDFGKSTFEVANHLMRTLHGEEGGKQGLEEFFGNHSIEAEIEYTIYSFRTLSDKSNKALFVIPGLHPGPLRGLGGSRISEILSGEIDSHDEVFTFHAPSTHSENPISEKECMKLPDSINTVIEDLNYSSRATPFVRKKEKGVVGGQRFENGVFTNLSFYPEPAEDVHASVGKMISQVGESYGLSSVGVVDSHNSGEKRVSTVFYPTSKAKGIIDTAEETFKSLKDLEYGELRIGIASKRDLEDEDIGISREGIKAAVIEVNGQKSAHILIDANNMKKGLRGEIQDGIEDLVDISELHTTDTHEVNTLLHSHQPLGAKISSERLIREIRELLKKAISDLESVEVAVKTGRIEDMELMGPINTNRINAVSQTLVRIIPSTIILAFSLQFILTLLFFYLGW